MASETSLQMRLDKWLWAARFFKTRALAQKQVELGRVLVNNERVKNSKLIQVGDILDLTINSLPFRLSVAALNHQRCPAQEAKLLYQEDEAILEKRMEMLEINKAMRDSNAKTDGRPTKRNRRTLERFKTDW